ncbi:MAG: endolytic transglycosylase MltG [Clostridia bacterium]|nr:endolytic transglycosylase MltG [Clostridia bacterium]
MKKKRFEKYSKTLGVFCLIAALLCLWLVFALGDIFGWSTDKTKVRVSIPDGCSVKEIADILENEDMVDSATFFRLYVKLKGDNLMFRMGEHILERGMSFGEIVYKLTSKPDAEFNTDVKITIPEGYEARQIADRLADEGLVDKEEFMEELESGEFDYWFVKEIERKENRLEGYLYPATYDISPKNTEHEIICKMLDAFEANIVPVYKSAETGMTLDQVVTFASVVEREAANDAERPVVASVFLNRIAKDMTLSSCATVQYIIKERKDILSESDIRIKSDYNTYMNKGLPIGPIASPGLNSVKAALYPADTDYLYFAARADGSENVFAETDEEHMKNVRELQGK